MRLAEVRLRPAHAPTADGRPPPSAEGRCGHETKHRTAGVDQPDQGRPDRDAAHEVVGAVDGVDDPLARAVTRRLDLLADDGVARAGALELRPDQLLGVAVGVADQSEVRLGLDVQVLGAKARHRHSFDGVREDVGEAKVVVIGRHVAST